MSEKKKNFIDEHYESLKLMPENIKDAHKHSIYNRREIIASDKCGCFSCCAIFKPEQCHWWGDDDDATALCPKCHTDAVLGSSAGFPITPEFLSEMESHWFSSVKIGTLSLYKDGKVTCDF